MQMNKYKLRVKHKKNDAYWEVVVLAPGALVAAHWFKNHTRSEETPVILQKNGQPYDAKNGDRAYYREISKQLKKGFNDKRLNAAQKRHLKKKDDDRRGRAEKFMHYCKIIEENAYVVD